MTNWQSPLIAPIAAPIPHTTKLRYGRSTPEV